MVEVINDRKVENPLQMDTSTNTIKKTDLGLSQLRFGFAEKLNTIINEFNITGQSANLWILNDLLIPLNTCNNYSSDKLGILKVKYTQPETYASIHVPNESENIAYPPISGTFDHTFDFVNDTEHLSMALSFKTNYELNKISNHIHSYFAYNQQCQVSKPLIVFPKSEALEPTLDANPIKNTASIERTQTGDLNNLSMFTNWIKLFAKQLKAIASSLPQSNNSVSKSPTILLLNSYIYLKLSNLTISIEQYNELISLLTNENICLMVYPVENKSDQINLNLFKKFCDIWTSLVLSCSMKENPNNETSFLFLYKESLRKLFMNKNLIRDSFNQLIRLYSLPIEQYPELPESHSIHQSLDQSQNHSGLPENVNVDTNDELDCDEERVEKKNEIKLSDLSDQEIEEYAQWVDEMSKIGCLSIKYTFLRELFLKCNF
jgi:hypothetical protein